MSGLRGGAKAGISVVVIVFGVAIARFGDLRMSLRKAGVIPIVQDDSLSSEG